MNISCQFCDMPGIISCACQLTSQIFCENHILSHLIDTKLVHSVEKLDKGLLCTECQIKNSSWNCSCKGESINICQNCIWFHINKNLYASHNLRKNLLN